MIENIIFDVDGTLWNASQRVTEAWNAVYARKGLPYRFSQSEVDGFMGMTLDEIEKIVFPDMPEAEKREIMDECTEEQNVLLSEKGGILYPALKETLKELSAGYGIYIVSNCMCGYIEALLSFSGLGAYVKGFLCAGETGKGKGDNLLLLMERYALKNCVYVGDTRRDELACEQAKIPFIWASYGFGKAERFAAKIDSISQVKEAVKKL